MLSHVSDSDKELYQLIGYAITQWQVVELGLFMNFWRFLHLPDFQIISSAFFGVLSFSAKLEMTENAGKSALKESPETLKEWERLCERCKKTNTKRNHLAHFTMIIDADDQNSPVGETYLAPNPINEAALHRWGDDPPKYSKRQLEELISNIRQLSRDLITFAANSDLPGSTSLPRSSPSQGEGG